MPAPAPTSGVAIVVPNVPFIPRSILNISNSPASSSPAVFFNVSCLSYSFFASIDALILSARARYSLPASFAALASLINA